MRSKSSARGRAVQQPAQPRQVMLEDDFAFHCSTLDAAFSLICVAFVASVAVWLKTLIRAQQHADIISTTRSVIVLGSLSSIMWLSFANGRNALRLRHASRVALLLLAASKASDTLLLWSAVPNDGRVVLEMDNHVRSWVLFVLAPLYMSFLAQFLFQVQRMAKPYIGVFLAATVVEVAIAYGRLEREVGPGAGWHALPALIPPLNLVAGFLACRRIVRWRLAKLEFEPAVDTATLALSTGPSSMPNPSDDSRLGRRATHVLGTHVAGDDHQQQSAQEQDSGDASGRSDEATLISLATGKSTRTSEGEEEDHPHEPGPEGLAAPDHTPVSPQTLSLADVPDITSRNVDAPESSIGGQTTCIVCFTNPKSCMAMPCAHQCVCPCCAAEIRKCPYCRAPVDVWVQPFVV